MSAAQLERVQALMTQRLAGLGATAERCRQTQNEVEARAKRLLVLLDVSDLPAVPRLDQEDVLAEVERLDKAYDLASVKRRVAREAITCVGHVKMPAARALRILSVHASLWDTARRHFLQHWDAFSDDQRRAWVTLLRSAPDAIVLIPGLIKSRTEFINDDAPMHAAGSVREGIGLEQLLASLRERGISAKSGFGQEFLTAWCLKDQDRTDRRLSDLMANSATAPLLVPLAFSKPLPVETQNPARLRFLKLLVINGLAPSSAANAAMAHTVSQLVKNLGDPRSAEHPFWHAFGKAHADAMARLKEMLSTEDLEFFFEHLPEKDSARLNFWRQNLKKVQRTLVVLSREDHRAVAATIRLPNVPERIRSAFARVNEFASAKPVSAFCLYYRGIVVVEFSVTGNAAYVYSNANFRQKYERHIQANLVEAAADLKDKAMAERTVSHMGRWEEKMRAVIRD